ncbi:MULTISPECIES: Arc family DNA-binding protein [Pseudomonadaceae]|uniref:Arc family DNA-binding protein n=1 Tax=Pseudomonadaceae TaxID=135621 RepID=UPI00103E7F99|nr:MULTISPECIES: Arc family DNA-binding protein [Pseudomonadaceae]TCD19170.1 Arc family DNA-binding protein [Pseudomonas sp. IC_126]
MSREDPQFKLRLPTSLKTRVEEAAVLNRRSINAEILARLEQSFSPADVPVASSAPLTPAEECRIIDSQVARILRDKILRAVDEAIAEATLITEEPVSKEAYESDGKSNSHEPSRKTIATMKVGSRSIEVEVRKKKHFVKRST